MSDDKVGYGRPPKHTQFKKGQSGNPAGKPKGSFSFKVALERLLRTKIAIMEDGVRKRIPAGDALLKRAMVKGLAGDLRAIGMLMSLLERHQSRDQREPEKGWRIPKGPFTLDFNQERDHPLELNDGEQRRKEDDEEDELDN